MTSADERPDATSGANLQATFCVTLVDEWVRAGVRHAVVAPGSRSTPMALALANDDRLSVHVHHDERAAAFLALGIGVATGVPAIVLTTSGTAAAELHPAVAEASYGRVPMLVVTADRPAELQSVGAAQTIDQTHLFGRSVRWFAAPGVPDAAAAPTWRSLASQAHHESVGVVPGPVHLNLAFREPLVGEAGEPPPGRPGGAPWHGAPSPVGGVAPMALPGGRGVIVAGGDVGDPAAVLDLGDRLGWPVLADPRSGCRVPGPTSVGAFDALLRHERFAASHRPDVIVRLGDPPASKALAAWMTTSGARQYAVGTGWADPQRDADVVVRARPDDWCRGATGTAADPSWRREWTEADAAAQRAIDGVLAAHHEATDPYVARSVMASAAGSLVVASSMPVRDVEWFAAPRIGLRVHANRGANGIDGVVSTAVGVAAGSDAPVTALVGDNAFLHDANALLGLASRRLDLTIVVVDNRGGAIFSFLSQKDLLPVERFEQLFGTPHDVDLAALAVVHGLPALTVHDADGLVPALAAASSAPGTHVVVVRTDREANVALHRELAAAVARALDGS
jgi:2-succinyl-5-enolpyruvyl-6-hydroxy-3-cyclohexene-1-carboxylate synthase